MSLKYSWGPDTGSESLQRGCCTSVFGLTSRQMSSLQNSFGSSVQGGTGASASSFNVSGDHPMAEESRVAIYWNRTPGRSKGSPLDCCSCTFQIYQYYRAIEGLSSRWWTCRCASGTLCHSLLTPCEGENHGSQCKPEGNWALWNEDCSQGRPLVGQSRHATFGWTDVAFKGQNQYDNFFEVARHSGLSIVSLEPKLM